MNSLPSELTSLRYSRGRQALGLADAAAAAFLFPCRLWHFKTATSYQAAVGVHGAPCPMSAVLRLLVPLLAAADAHFISRTGWRTFLKKGWHSPGCYIIIVGVGFGSDLENLIAIASWLCLVVFTRRWHPRHRPTYCCGLVWV